MYQNCFKIHLILTTSTRRIGVNLTVNSLRYTACLFQCGKGSNTTNENKRLNVSTNYLYCLYAVGQWMPKLNVEWATVKTKQLSYHNSCALFLLKSPCWSCVKRGTKHRKIRVLACPKSINRTTKSCYYEETRIKSND